MSCVYVTSDWHIGHTGISNKFRSQFHSDEEHDNYILGCARAMVTKRDVLIVVGDVTWTQKGLQKIKDTEFPCIMRLVLGNHDTLPVQDYLEVFDTVHGALKYGGFMFTHIPMHRQELGYGSMIGNIHGHCHRGGPWEVNKEPEYFNAILEFNDYLPVNMQQVRKIMHSRHIGES